MPELPILKRIWYSLRAMSSLIEQLQKLEEQKKALIGGVLQEIKEKIDLLNAAGFHYRLVEGPEAGTTKRGGEGKRRLTSEHAFLAKMKAASFRKWGKTAEAKKEELWKKEEPLAKKFYVDSYKDGVNTSGQKYRTQIMPSSK
jgi:hypothetical protein